jgi:hypothetical protein
MEMMDKGDHDFYRMVRHLPEILTHYLHDSLNDDDDEPDTLRKPKPKTKRTEAA